MNLVLSERRGSSSRSFRSKRRKLMQPKQQKYNMEKYKVYKVLKEDYCGNLVSSDVHHPNWQLKYTIGKTTRAKPGSLGVFVFLSLACAMDYAFGYCVHEAWSEHKPERVEYIGDFNGFWENLAPWFTKASFTRRVKGASRLWHYAPPEGCYVVPEITMEK